MRIFTFAAVLIWCAVSLAAAPKRPPVVTFEKINSVELKAGSKAEAVLNANILKGYHIQANPASEPFLIATTLELEKSDPVETSGPIYPAGKPYRLEGSPKDYSTYDSKVEIKVPLSAGADAKPGDYKITGKLRYQACDDKMCLAPTWVPAEIQVHLTAK
jgi:hypothetical protein